MKKAFSFLIVAALILMPAAFVFAGGDETGDTGNQLKNTEKALEDQNFKTNDLENKVADMQKQLDDLKNRPAAEEKKFELPIHGFFNVNYADSNLASSNGTFDQENFNLTYDYVLDENFKFFGEVGFRNGEEIDVDLNSVSGVGEVNVVNAWLDWKFSNAATLKFGKFLTPYGTWNVNNHSPAVYLSVWEPILIRRDLFPRTMTGVQFYGETPAFSSFDFIYNAYLGNGKGWRPNSEDDNTNKGVGSRLALRTPFLNIGTIEFGANGYMGRDGNLNDEDENVYGWDALLNAFPFQVRGEFARSRYMLQDYKWFQDAWFLMGSYNFLEKYDAYLRFDHEDRDYSQAVLADELKVTSIGINYKPIPKVAFKLEYDFYRPESTDDYEVVAGSVAVDF
jgi:hypothetical protein